MPRVARLLPFLLAIPAAGAAATAYEPPVPAPNLVLAAGAAEIFDSDTFACASVNYRPALRLAGFLGPDLMAGTGRHHEFYAAAGVFCELPLVSRLRPRLLQLRRPRTRSGLRSPVLHLPPARLAL